MDVRDRPRPAPARAGARVRGLTARGLALLALALASAPAAPAAAQELSVPASRTSSPPGYDRNADQIERIADRDPKVRAERSARGELNSAVYTRDSGGWQVSYFDGEREVVQVYVDDGTGRVTESWTGPAVAWKMARGYDGAFGRSVNAPYVFLPFCALFLLPFLDPRRPFRLIHLDLLVLLAFGISHYFFNRAEITTSVPLVYPFLVYLLVRMLLAGLRPRRRAGPLVPVVPVAWLTIALLFVVGFRVVLNVTDSNVIDVGYAGVIGADLIVEGESPWGGGFPENNHRGDTYGPANYLAYVPFEQAMSWSGSWDDLPAAHGAALAFDLLTMLGLFLLGRRLRPGEGGQELGIVLAFAWAAYPYALFSLSNNGNDALVSMLVVGALLGLSSAPARGALVGLAAAAKFAPLALAPLFVAGTGERRWRSGAVAAGVLLVTLAITFLPLLPEGGFREIYDRTLAYQADRDSPFSIWGQEPSIDFLQPVVVVGAGLLALLVAFVPRRRSPAQVAALGAAVLVALQIGVDHWFYLYLVWFAPLVFVAIFSELGHADESDAGGEPAAGLARA